MKKTHKLHQVSCPATGAPAPVVWSEETLRVPGTVLPEQFFTPQRESHVHWTGERLLMLAVLQEAVHSYLRYATAKTHRGRRLFSEIWDWFRAQDRGYLYSFESICLHLQLDPDYVRRGLQTLLHSTAPRPPLPRSLPQQRTVSATSISRLAA